MSEGQFDTPEARWCGVGPYYAMFPARFADAVIKRHSSPGDVVFDPFAGRGTSLFSASISGRHGVGVEINPVGWTYAATKLNPASRGRVERRAREIGEKAKRFGQAAAHMPEFFSWCFSPTVLEYLLAARSHLNWRGSITDRTLMAILLVDLHGKRTLAFSNQMRQTKAMSPDYAVRWWKSRGLRPPKRDPVEHTLAKIAWRFARGIPAPSSGRVILGDSTHRHTALERTIGELSPRGASLLLTSPPYLGVTNYHYDQWLRLWLLGGGDAPRSWGEPHRGKFTNPDQYRELLSRVFSQSARLLAPNATIYVRTDHRSATARVTREVLREVFPNKRMRRRRRPLEGRSQTRLFGHVLDAPGDVDFVLTA